uniref:Uncharacterized protein n=1 Tax=Timema tahoe TaxID=61484 RepID=A0A7R9IAM3_9NEOP|nr:unnamed protein product [Timema tahoe]
MTTGHSSQTRDLWLSLPMCMSKRVCAALHVIWSLVYVGTGSIQLIAGIFFLISLPVFRVGSNIWTGAWIVPTGGRSSGAYGRQIIWCLRAADHLVPTGGRVNIVVGIGGGMLSCVGDLNAKKQEALLFFTISILALNVVNIVILEVGEWHYFLTDTTREFLSQKNVKKLVFYAHITTSVSTAIAILSSFLDSQFTFCSMTRTKEAKNVHEQVSDIEYIIPRKKSNSVAKQAHSIYSQYAQSWVFDTDTTASSKNDSPYLKLPNVSPNDSNKTYTMKNHKSAVIEINGTHRKDPSMFIVNPVVHVEPVSDDSNGGRTLNYMKSFSRTPSPVGMSESSSQDSSMNPPIYECLERLTEPAIYRSRLNTALSLNAEKDMYQLPRKGSVHNPDRPSTSRDGLVRPRSETFTKDRLSVVENLDPNEKVQYASLMVELQQAFLSKKGKFQQPASPQSACDSTTVEDVSDRTQSESKGSSCQESSQDDSQKTDKKNSDAEFSKELEAALQLIQDLESPNTIETPSETCRSIDGVEVTPAVICVKWKDSSDASESTKTLSECVSPAEMPEEDHITVYSQHGKRTSIVVVAPSGSESSSGYSSPSAGTSKRPTPVGSKPPSVSGSASSLERQPVTFAIRNTGSAAVISLFCPTGNSVGRKSGTSIVAIADHSADRKIFSPSQKPTMPTETNNNNIPVKSNRHGSDSSKTSDKRLGVSRCSSLGSSDTSTLKGRNSYQSSLSSSSSSRWNVKSLLRRRSSNQPPVLAPELEGAIFKSESLAYLTDLELLARHARNKSIQRVRACVPKTKH